VADQLSAKTGVMKRSEIGYGTVLGNRVHITDYAEATGEILRLAHSGGVHCVAAANTHLMGEAAVNADFAAILRSFDLVVPDGMPLVWALQLDGAAIQERVYGPYLMQKVLAASTARTRHFFLGGTEETLATLRERVLRDYPGVEIVGVLSPPFGAWSAAEEGRMIDAVNAAEPHCIWVALGGVKQETWIHAVRGRINQGVLLAVGDAFILNAGLRSFAPSWLQGLGLTWAWRLLQEPRRLAQRYMVYHSRFVKAFLYERWRLTWR
jgi:N-acetylglucosaminyldiphosphoundecaprenol N-acetyl-beta-D-mannosaminyltransferase